MLTPVFGNRPALDGIPIWRSLARNAVLPGGVKHVIIDDGSIALRAEIPLEGLPAHVITQRTMEICKGLASGLKRSAKTAEDTGLSKDTPLTDLCTEAELIAIGKAR